MAVFVTINEGGIDYGFDFIDQEIEVQSIADSIPAADLKSAIRRAEWSRDGMVFPDIAETKNPTVLDPVNNVSDAQTVILLDLWRILTLKASGLFIVTEGNTVRFDTGVDIFASNPTVNAANIVSAFATTVATGGGGGGDATEANQNIMITKLDQIIAIVRRILPPFIS